ncbi:hypothetical protein MMC11_008963 [Xylographa trunciseda]|nr:hypothetical protein [Xylographa trunciseda]
MEGFEAKLHHIIADSEKPPKSLTIDKTEEKEDTDPARGEKTDVDHDARWSKLSEKEQARLLERCFSKLYGIPKPEARTLLAKPSKRSMMQTPCTSEPGELGHLCEVCRHVDFRYLVDCPLAQVLESFKLFPLKWALLREEDCAFCRLIAKTVRGALGGGQLVTAAQGKDIMCDFKMLPKAMNPAGRAEMILRLLPQPVGIHDFTYLILSEYHAGKDVMTRMTNYGASVESPRVDSLDVAIFKGTSTTYKVSILQTFQGDFDPAISESVQNSRAWTLQEKGSSPRVLYFGDQRCFFTCHHSQVSFMESDDTIENGLERTKWSGSLGDGNVNLIPTTHIVNIIAYRRVVQPSKLASILSSAATSSLVSRAPSSTPSSSGSPAAHSNDGVTQERTSQASPPGAGLAGSGKANCNDDENLSRIEWIGADGSRFSNQDFSYPAGANADVYKRLGRLSHQWGGALQQGVPYYMEKSRPERYFFHPTAPEEERMLGPKL